MVLYVVDPKWLEVVTTSSRVPDFEFTTNAIFDALGKHREYEYEYEYEMAELITGT